MERSSKIYYNEVDIIKGVAILLVMLGHSELVDNLPPIIHRFNQYYSMALFMFASGFLFSAKGSWSVFVKKKAKRLVVPYVSFGIFTLGMKYCKYGGGISLFERRSLSFRNGPILLVPLCPIHIYDCYKTII